MANIKRGMPAEKKSAPPEAAQKALMEQPPSEAEAASEAAFSSVESTASAAPVARAKTSWTGALSVNVPAIGLNGDYRLKMGKIPTSEDSENPLGVRKVDKKTGHTVEAKESMVYYRYTEDATGKRSDPIEVSYDDLKANVKYPAKDGQDWKITAKKEYRYLDMDAMSQGQFVQVPNGDVTTMQGDEEVSPFGRTERIEVGPEDWIPLSRLPEYATENYYHINANTKKGAEEVPSRVRDLARKLQEKQVALITGFAWREGFSYHTSVIFPVERDDGLYLVFAATKGRRVYDTSWNLDTKGKEVGMLPTARPPKPKVTLSK